MAKNSEQIEITANTTQAQLALATLQVRLKGLSEYAEKLNTKFEGVSQASDKFMGKLERLGIASVFAEGGIFGLVNKVADVGFELKEAAEKTGMSTKQLQFWQYAAKQSNIDSGTLTNAMTRLNVSMGMAHKATSQQAMAFRFLHVNLRDASGQYKSSNEVFKETVSAIANVKDKGLQAAASQILLSRSARELLPLMKNISEHSGELSDGFKKYGYVLSDDAIKQSENFHRSSVNLKVALESLGMSIGQRLMPILQPIVDRTLDYVSANRQVLATNIASTILEIAKGFNDAWRALHPFLAASWSLIKALGGIKTVVIALTSIYIAQLIISFAALVRAVWALNAALILNPVGFVITALALIGFAVYKLFQLIKPYLPTWEHFWQRIVAVVQKARAILVEIFKDLNPKNLFKDLESLIAKIPSNFTANIVQSPLLASPTGALGAPAMMGAMMPAMAPAANPSQNNSLNVHMKIDHEGKPQITKVQSSSPVNFTANIGLTR